MKTTHYLYACSSTDFMDLPYRQALEFKRDKAHALIGLLHQPHYNERDDERLLSVIKSEKFNRELLEELEAETKDTV